MDTQIPRWLTLVGIGEDGLAGLGEPARQAVLQAKTLFGGRRHLALMPDRGQERIAWPSPFSAAFEMLLARRGTPVCVLASGDPMWFGIGASLARLLPAEEFRVYPAPSSFALAAARLGWPVQDTVCLSVHGRPLEALHPQIHLKARLLILSENGATPAAIARLLCERGFGASRLSVLEHLGGPNERRLDGSAADWPHDRTADLNLVAADCLPDPDAARLSILAGLPDSAFINDGQLTKRDVRAATLAHLAPSPGELLWDVGAGCGSIGIEWMRCHPSCRAVAIEADATRCGLIDQNRRRLGVPGLRVVYGRAPEMLRGLDPPDAIFVGGGLSDRDVLERCWDALPPGGRLVANAVTLQSEAILTLWRERTGGDLTRISVAHAGPLGRFDGWRTAMPVTLLAAAKPVVLLASADRG
ncbi:MAG TPA: precorrin-6y C5,15-methyltransferase (decarboxylating) subunit CbiE [Stellaceae bacterium]|jgi:precorrin-6Y C5,15-methyltransferase (decarboxylating)